MLMFVKKRVYAVNATGPDLIPEFLPKGKDTRPEAVRFLQNIFAEPEQYMVVQISIQHNQESD